MIPSFPALARGITDIARACLVAAGDDVEHHEVQSKLDNFVKNLMLQMERSGFNYRKWHKDMLSDYKWLGGELVGTALDPLMKNRERNRQMPRCGEWGVDLFGDTIPGMPRVFQKLAMMANFSFPSDPHHRLSVGTSVYFG